ncbi:hypothetical protein DT603_04990 [Pseudoxanthomonas gei]|uniref:SPOR domain-containing protein n=1 Tax=Pseudoxanthomonas gei TaxID=1383030 RepID=A0ABX0A9J2_9GAMM|nr:hypothetical protein [Pseudoxanthomonas gei]NDK38195.1 hypothetical protein [Pseudoxanthomonas gei]
MMIGRTSLFGRFILGAILTALGLPTIAGPATKWKTCYFEGTGGMGLPLALIVIEPFEIAAEHEGTLVYPTTAFEQDPGVSSVVPGYTRFSSATYGCDEYETRERAQARADRVKGWGSYSITRSVEWSPPSTVTGLGGTGKKGASVRAVRKPSPSAGGPGATVIDAAAPPVIPGWDEKVREQLRKEADTRAKSAALAAANDTRLQAEVAEALRKMKARGRAQ